MNPDTIAKIERGECSDYMLHFLTTSKIVPADVKAAAEKAIASKPSRPLPEDR